MAITHGIEILVDSSVSDDEKIDILSAVLRVLREYTVSPVTNTTYSAGSTSSNQVGIEISGASEDYGIRVIFDSAVVSNKAVLTILASLIQVLRSRAIVPVFTSTYTAGDRTYNHVLTCT